MNLKLGRKTKEFWYIQYIVLEDVLQKDTLLHVCFLKYFAPDAGFISMKGYVYKEWHKLSYFLFIILRSTNIKYIFWDFIMGQVAYIVELKEVCHVCGVSIFLVLELQNKTKTEPSFGHVA